MEKVTVTGVVPVTSKNGKSYQTVTLATGLVCSAWEDDFVPFMNKEVTVDLVKKGNYTNIYMPKEKKDDIQVSTQPKSRPDVFELRKASALLGLDAATKLHGDLKREHVAYITKWYEGYLSTGNFEISQGSN